VGTCLIEHLLMDFQDTIFDAKSQPQGGEKTKNRQWEKGLENWEGSRGSFVPLEVRGGKSGGILKLSGAVSASFRINGGDGGRDSEERKQRRSLAVGKNKGEYPWALIGGKSWGVRWGPLPGRQAQPVGRQKRN